MLQSLDSAVGRLIPELTLCTASCIDMSTLGMWLLSTHYWPSMNYPKGAFSLKKNLHYAFHLIFNVLVVTLWEKNRTPNPQFLFKKTPKTTRSL